MAIVRDTTSRVTLYDVCNSGEALTYGEINSLGYLLTKTCTMGMQKRVLENLVALPSSEKLKMAIIAIPTISKKVLLHGRDVEFLPMRSYTSELRVLRTVLLKTEA